LVFDHPTQKTVQCKMVEQRPHLDGLLSDDCWQQAEEIPLSDKDVPLDPNSHAVVFVAHDAEHLYFAMSIPKVAGLPDDAPVTLGRKHDQDLSRYDRVALHLDIDRDFLTWYTIEIDQRGCVAESCCGDSGWNPKLYVKADNSDSDRWRIEGAIPLRELVPRPPQAGDTWGLAVVRTVPAVRLESWSHPAARQPRPETFGLIRFQ
jgi:hypothetical protein